MTSRLEAKHRDSPYLVGMAFSHPSEGPMGLGGRGADLFAALGSACAGRDAKKVGSLLASLKGDCVSGSLQNADASLARLERLVAYGRTHYNSDVFGLLMETQTEVRKACRAKALEAEHADRPSPSGSKPENADAALVEAAKNGDLDGVKRHVRGASKEAKLEAMKHAVGDKEPYFDLAQFEHPQVVRFLADMK